MPHRILFIAAFETPFILDDLAFLRSRYDVTPMIGSGPIQAGRISMKVSSADVVFAWFASVYGAMAVLTGASLGKRTFIQVGGVDVASEPDLGYGLWTSRWKSKLVGQALRTATRVLAVDESLVTEAKERARYEGRNIEVLPTGFDPDRWTRAGAKEPRIVCVAAVSDAVRLKVKGIDVLVEAARRAPDLRFTIIGIHGELAASLGAPSNVELVPWTPQGGLLSHLSRASVYCQPSRREGLPNALCESMLCECIPVATAVGGNPRAVGNAGLLVEPNDPDALVRALRLALALPPSHGQAAREHVVQRFSLARRRDRLIQLIESGPETTA
ncbi:MAG: glycosyltransferase family 4 protein [Bacteroidetes bacterium]|jgi:glycosyltransferase involved in cell wall biosynthesis|nr:glycosyltransferase family 4 protein [Bacteroidota bacterium]